MEYLSLLEKLREKNVHGRIYANPSPGCELLSARLLSGSEPGFLSSCVYLCVSSCLPAPDTGGIFTIFCCGEDADFSIYNDSSFNITYFGTDISLPDLFNCTMEILSETQTLAAGMHILINALFSGNGLQYLTDTAADLFGNPVCVVDLQNKYLALSAGIVPNNKILDEENASGYVSEAGIHFIQANRINEKVRKSPSAYYCINPVFQTGMLIDAVQIQGIETAHIMMLESMQPFRSYDADFFHYFSKLVSMELQKDSAYSRNKGVMYSYFLADLITHPEKDAADIKERMELMGYQPKENFYIVAIPPDGHNTSDLKLNVILEYMKRIFSGSIYVIYEDTIVFLISRDLDQTLSTYEISQLEDFLTANHLKAGISNFYRDLADTSRFFKQAADSVYLGLKLKDPSPVYYYSDYYLYKLLENFEKEDSKIQFLIHPGLMKLYLHDKEHGTEFMQTLIEYLKQPGQPGKIAAALHVHKNTLLYRLGKIKDITGCALTNGEDFMNFNISIIIMKYLRML